MIGALTDWTTLEPHWFGPMCEIEPGINLSLCLNLLMFLMNKSYEDMDFWYSRILYIKNEQKRLSKKLLTSWITSKGYQVAEG